jgi:beta-lactamase class A
MKKQIVIYLFSFFMGLTIGIFLSRDSKRSADSQPMKNEISSTDSIEYREDGFQFTSPLLDCDINQSPYQGQSATLREQVRKIIDKKTRESSASNIAIYFRDLNNGPWFGVNEDAKFVPASLMKVPVMIAYFKLSETNPDILEKKIEVEKITENNFDQHFGPSQKIESGKTYSVYELIYFMVAYSDNDALTLLLQNIDQKFLLQTYTDLGVIIPGAKNLDDELSVREYSSFFRILYNASYLNRENSERALQVLSQSDFRDGIVAGLPESIQTAHKFGERFSKSAGDQPAIEKQLHDCGIVYDPGHPYLVCIMSKGNDFNDLSGTIQEISRTVFESIQAAKSDQ